MSLFESRDGTRIREPDEEREAPRVRRAARRAVRSRRERPTAEALAQQGDLFPEMTPPSIATTDVEDDAPPTTPRPALKLVELPRTVAAEPTAPEPPAPTATAEHPGRMTADQWFEMGADLETESPLEARAAYHHALEMNPMLVDAHVNLGRLYHEAGEHGKAEAHYREATLLAPRDPTSHFNLGVLLEDLDRRTDAVYAYRQALARDADYADAHYNLALLLERLGRKSEAISHLAKARALYGPNGRRT